jgi:acyl-CoA-binding protein
MERTNSDIGRGVASDFDSAVSFVSQHAASDLKMSDAQKLELYALFKQSTMGDADKKKQPSAFNLVRRSRFDAWLQLKGTNPTEAKEECAPLPLPASYVDPNLTPLLAGTATSWRTWRWASAGPRPRAAS